MTELARVLALSDYNTRVVLLGSAILGLASGLIGTFMMLRRRALISDVVSHAALPGIAAAFLLTAGWAGGGKQLPVLLAGAFASGLLGMACVHLIKAHSHIKEDAALGIVLSVFFGAGVVLMGFAQRTTTASAAGLDTFIYGKTASMLAGDAWLMAGMALLIAAVCAGLFKELRLLCFDPEFARTQGWPVRRLDAVLTVLVVTVTVIGLPAVGLILMIALLMIPPAAARFWTDRLGAMVAWSSMIGATGAVAGATLSAVFPRVPAGAMMVLSCTALFIVSLIAGTKRGLLRLALRRARLTSRMERQHLLRAMYECIEVAPGGLAHPGAEPSVLVNMHQLTATRSWRPGRLEKVLRHAAHDGDVELDGWPMLRLTPAGLRHARQVVRNHRLWEWYLIQHAEVAASHVDRDADEIEHVLGPDMVAELERSLPAALRAAELPGSPHQLDVPAGGEARS